ncbi:hypothetical protein BD309DRAFT_972592 [Dichomitus squalens]|nr:hypothetical protein BD309DRAFT_972592 [Dichomitus squalens]
MLSTRHFRSPTTGFGLPMAANNGFLQDAPTAPAAIRFLKQELERSTEMEIFQAFNARAQLSFTYEGEYELTLARTGYTVSGPHVIIHYEITLRGIVATKYRVYATRSSSVNAALNKAAVLTCLEHLIQNPDTNTRSEPAQA